MSVADREDISRCNTNADDQPSEEEEAGDGLCFVCGDPLTRVAVWQTGNNGSYIWLHGKCAERLGARLIVDAHKAVLAEKGIPQEFGIVPSLGGYWGIS